MPMRFLTGQMWATRRGFTSPPAVLGALHLCYVRSLVCGARATADLQPQWRRQSRRVRREQARELAKEILRDNKGHLASTNLNIGDSLGLLALLVGVVLVLNYRLVT